MKRSTVAALMVAGAVAVVALGGLLVWGGHKLWKGVSGSPSTPEERRLVLDSAALRKRGVHADPRCDRFRTVRNIDASVHVEATHQCPGDGIYFNSRAEMHRGEVEARQSFALGITGMKTGLALAAGVELRRRDDLLDFGDQRYAAIITRDGSNIGNLFAVREGPNVHTLLVSGLYFDDPAAVRELLQPMIEAAKKR